MLDDDDDDIDSAFALLHLQCSPTLHYFCLNLQVRIALSSLNKIIKTNFTFSFIFFLFFFT